MPRLWGRRYRKTSLHFLFRIFRVSYHRRIILQLQWRFFLSELAGSRVLYGGFFWNGQTKTKGEVE